jgi:hypothetical protein
MDTKTLREIVIAIHKDPDDPRSMSCAAHDYFEASNLSNWCDVAHAADKLILEASGRRLETEELEGAVLHAVAAQSYYGALNTVADLLGLDREAMQYTVDLLTELSEDGELDTPMTPEDFKKEVDGYAIATAIERMQRYR